MVKGLLLLKYKLTPRSADAKGTTGLFPPVYVCIVFEIADGELLTEGQSTGFDAPPSISRETSAPLRLRQISPPQNPGLPLLSKSNQT